MKIYKLYHSYISKTIKYEKYSSSFLLGFFDSLEFAKGKIDEYKKQPGFKDYPSGFDIVQYEFLGDLREVYYVDHEYYIPEEDCDVITEIGVFASEEEANQAIDKLKNENSSLYAFNPDGFVVEKYSINECMWQEGFTSWNNEA